MVLLGKRGGGEGGLSFAGPYAGDAVANPYIILAILVDVT